MVAWCSSDGGGVSPPAASMTALLALFLSQVRFPSLLVHLLHRFSIDINMREHTLTEQL